MSVHLDWQIGEEDGEPPQRQRRQWPFSSVFTLLVIAGVLGVILGLWESGRRRVQQFEAQLAADVEHQLEQAQAAFQTGDGDRFFAAFSAAPGWRMVQFRPELNTIWRHPLTVTRVEAHGDEIWAVVSWIETGRTQQRILFFRRAVGNLLLIPQPATYWQGTESQPASWGILRYDGRDSGFAAGVAEEVSATVSALCRSGCAAGKLPFTLTLSTDTNETAAPNEIRLPSPRLLALDETGRPGPLFWNTLQRYLADYLAPATIRFGVPAAYAAHYADVLPHFAAAYPEIRVELVPLPEDGLTSDTPLPPGLDGAVLVPDLNRLASGQIADLTDYAYSDPGFDVADFYNQIWPGGWWQDRLFLLPHSAVMPLLYIDQETYQRTGRADPSLRWTWAEMEADIRAIGGQAPAGQWALLDPSRVVLFSYAYNWEAERCAGGNCAETLSPAAIQAAHQWFADLAAQPGNIPPFAALDPGARQQQITTRLAFRDIAIWSGAPVDYELNLGRGGTGVRPFPGSDQFEGVTPLFVQGMVIFRESDRPRATWQWLSFLSRFPVARQLRHIPARPSVARESGYWATLPRPVGDVMRTAFPFSRPVLLSDQHLFSWSQLAEIHSGAGDPAGVARATPPLDWFSIDHD